MEKGKKAQVVEEDKGEVKERGERRERMSFQKRPKTVPMQRLWHNTKAMEAGATTLANQEPPPTCHEVMGDSAKALTRHKGAASQSAKEQGGLKGAEIEKEKLETRSKGARKTRNKKYKRKGAGPVYRRLRFEPNGKFKP